MTVQEALALLPFQLRQPWLGVFLLTVGLQATGFKTRAGGYSRTARGWWALERRHVEEVLRFSPTRGALVEAAAALGYRILMMEPRELSAALEHNDLLSASVGACLAWAADPVSESVGMADLYMRTWQPRRTQPQLWDAQYAAAVAAWPESGGM